MFALSSLNLNLYTAAIKTAGSAGNRLAASALAVQAGAMISGHLGFASPPGLRGPFRLTPARAEEMLQRWHAASTSIIPIAPEEAAKLSPAEKLSLAEQLFDEVDEIEEDLIHRFGRVSADLQKVQKVQAWYKDKLDRIKAFEQAIERELPPREGQIARYYHSSYAQVLTGFAHVLSALVSALQRSTQHYGRSPLHAFIVSTQRIEIPLDEGHAFSLRRSRREFAFQLAASFVRNASSRHWRDACLIMRLPLSGIDTQRGFDLLQSIAWPPNPDDPLLQSFFRISGWTLNIARQGSNVIATIDFGEHLVGRV